MAAMTSRLISLVALCSWLASCPGLSQDDYLTLDSEKKLLAKALVEQLGNDSGVIRDHAARQLCEIGLEAVEAVQDGLRSPDLEVRSRCERIAFVLHEHEKEDKLSRFMLGSEYPSDSFPLWPTFRESFGDNSESRRLFVEMMQCESRLLELAESHPSKLGSAIGDVVEFRRAERNSAEGFPVGSISAVLFTMTLPDVRLPSSIQRHCMLLCGEPSFRATHFSRKRPICELLFREAVKSVDITAVGIALAIARDRDDSISLHLSARILSDRVHTSTQDHLVAMMTVAELGAREHLPLLESYADDETGIHRSERNDQRYECFLSDFAIACWLLADRQDLKSFGFASSTKSVSEMSPGSIAFANQQDRAQMRRLWREHRDRMISETGDTKSLEEPR